MPIVLPRGWQQMRHYDAALIQDADDATPRAAMVYRRRPRRRAVTTPDAAVLCLIARRHMPPLRLFSPLPPHTLPHRPMPIFFARGAPFFSQNAATASGFVACFHFAACRLMAMLFLRWRMRACCRAIAPIKPPRQFCSDYFAAPGDERATPPRYAATARCHAGRCRHVAAARFDIDVAARAMPPICFSAAMPERAAARFRRCCRFFAFCFRRAEQIFSAFAHARCSRSASHGALQKAAKPQSDIDALLRYVAAPCRRVYFSPACPPAAICRAFSMPPPMLRLPPRLLPAAFDADCRAYADTSDALMLPPFYAAR